MNNTLKTKKPTIVICACLLVLIPVLDQLTKYLVRVFMTVGQSVSVWGEFFRITYVLNDGMAFGMGGGWRWVFMILTPLLLICVAFAFFRFFKTLKAPTAAALVMIFAGGLSNMIDRIFFIDLDPSSKGLFDGRVVDFFDFNITLFGKRVWNAVFNVADAFVVVGVFTLIVMLIISEVEDRKKKKAAGAENAPATDGPAPGAEAPENGPSDAASSQQTDENPPEATADAAEEPIAGPDDAGDEK